MEKAQREIDKIERKLSQASFVERAPKEVVEENRRRLAEYQDQAAKLADGLNRLGLKQHESLDPCTSSCKLRTDVQLCREWPDG